MIYICLTLNICHLKHLILNIFKFIFDFEIYLKKLCGTVTVYFRYNLSPFLIFTNVMSSEFVSFLSFFEYNSFGTFPP